MTDDDSDDPVRRYTPEEQLLLTRHLEAVTLEVHRGTFRERPLDLGLLCEFHRALFAGVRDGHAGKIRKAGFGAEYLTFGPNRSAHRDTVERQLRAVFEQVARDRARLADVRGSGGAAFDEGAIRLAVRAHADIVRIHPFEDGNGRTSRLCAGHLLVQHGLRPIPVEAVKQEYTGALNEYYERHDLEPIVDLFIQLYVVDS